MDQLSPASGFPSRRLIERILISKTDSIFIQLFRYGIVGGLAAGVDIGSFTFFFYVLSIDYRIAVFLSFTLGTLTNFCISNVFVFDRKSLQYGGLAPGTIRRASEGSPPMKW
ncbi:MAG TPA: GtrA family protein [Deltaproteobacteria bacterium]|nr:GtrA family protein [Deltaproteobacteria bacterium]